MAGTALVIEDDTDIRFIETTILESDGWTVVAAPDGAAGIAAALAATPDVVLCDLTLPDMGGLDVIRALKKEAATAAVPVLVVTAMSSDDALAACLDAGAHDYVTKPLRMVEFLARCRAALRASRDITERQEQAAALARSENEHRVVFESAPVGMAQVGLDGRFLRVNPALCNLLGYTAEQLCATDLMAITDPADAEWTARAVCDMAAGALRELRVDTRFVHAEGRTVWVALSSDPIFDVDGRVDHLLTHSMDLTERKELEERLRHLADHDPLTELLNRRGFEAALRRHIDHQERYGPGGALLMLDLDGFKHVNDTLGHEAGDRVIIAAAHSLTSRLRRSDVLARLGGDEFAVILPHVDTEQALIVAEAMVEQMQRCTTLLPDGHTVSVTTSVGVAMFASGRTGSDMMAQADRALYAAKDAGRNGFALHDSGPGAHQPEDDRAIVI